MGQGDIVRGVIIAVLLSVVTFPSTATAALELDFYWKEGCGYCAKAKVYLPELQKKFPDLVIRSHNIEADTEARQQLVALLDTAGYDNWGVPVFLIGSEIIIGFGDRTPAAIEALLGGKERESILEQAVDLPLVGKVALADLGLPLFTILLGLADGFNPCAMWVLVFLLTILVNLKSRRKMALIAGTFVVVSGLVYFAFMAAWLNFFFVIGLTRLIQVGLGCFAVAVGAIHIKDFFAFKKGISFSIPDSAKPRLYRKMNQIVTAENMTGALWAVVTLAVLVNIVELACTAGLPMIYTQVLAAHELAWWQHYGYLALYNLAYMFDDGIMVGIAVVTLSRKKMQEKSGRILKLVSGLMIAILGIVMIFFPGWLDLSF